MSAIQNILTNIKAHVLECNGFNFVCGFDNVKELNDKVSGIDLGNGEYMPISFDDSIGNYFWIEPVADVSFRVKKSLSISDCIVGYEAQQRASLFAVAHNANELNFFECLVNCLIRYGCGLVITGGNYNSLSVVDARLAGAIEEEHINMILSHIENLAIVRIDFAFSFEVLPTDNNCSCEIC